jgi:hypothetical protein
MYIPKIVLRSTVVIEIRIAEVCEVLSSSPYNSLWRICAIQMTKLAKRANSTGNYAPALLFDGYVITCNLKRVLPPRSPDFTTPYLFELS